MSNVDDVITKITEAPNDGMARAILQSVPHRLLVQVADQLHIDPEGHQDGWIKAAIVKEARALSSQRPTQATHVTTSRSMQ